MTDRYVDMNTGFPEESLSAESKLQILEEVRAECAVPSNNRKAIGIHFLLSLLGFLAALAITPADGEGIFELAIVVVGGMLIYVACAFTFLKPVASGAWRSFIWLFVLTLIAGVLSAAGIILLDIFVVDTHHSGGNLDDFASLMMSAILFLNTVGLGVFALGAPVIEAVAGPFFTDPAFTAIFLVLVAIIPPGLFYLGLRLKMWRDANEKSSEVSEARAHE